MAKQILSLAQRRGESCFRSNTSATRMSVNNIPPILLLSVVALTSCLVVEPAACYARLRERYLNLAPSQRQLEEPQTIRLLEQTMAKLNIGPKTRQRDILAQAETLANEAEKNGAGSETFYSMLGGLANDNTGEQFCENQEHIRNWLLLRSHLLGRAGNQLSAKHEKLLDYLEHFGRKKFSDYVEKRVHSNASSWEVKMDLWSEKLLDKYFTEALKLERTPDDRKLFDNAKRLELSKFSSRKLIMLASVWNERAGENEVARELLAFYLKNERKLAPGSGLVFDLINLAQDLDTQKPVDNLKVMKLNEYQRIVCVSPWRDTYQRLGGESNQDKADNGSNKFEKLCQFVHLVMQSLLD